MCNAHKPSTSLLPARVAILLAGTIIAIVTGGAAFEKDIVTAHRFDLDGEWTLPALFSGALLFAAGSLAFLAGGRVGNARLPYVLFGGFLISMGLDEVCSIHERLEAATSTDWQILYAPVILLGGTVWILLVRTFDRRAQPFWLMATGAWAWVVAQVLENVQWGGGTGAPVDAYARLMLIEETLEMVGSACFVVALYTVLYQSGDTGSAFRTLGLRRKLTRSS